MQADLAKLAGAVFAAGGREVVFVANPAQAFTAALRLQGREVEVLPSVGVAPGTIIAIDPGTVAASVDPTPDFDRSIHALLHMEADDPAAISTPGTPNVSAGNLRSLFQTDSLGVRCILSATWARRSGAVAYMTDVAW